MLSFFPGPAKVYPQVREYLLQAYDQGILSLPHRGQDFMQLSRETVELLREKLNIPADYQIYFTTSATECWELLIQSLVTRRSYHLYNGSFGSKWFEYARQIRPDAIGESFDANDSPEAALLTGLAEAELLCLTHNETSNGTQLPQHFLTDLRQRHPKLLIAVDATSSMGGVDLRVEQADVWFASVQKCFGLPAGLGLLVCGPRALERARQLRLPQHYDSLLALEERMQQFQTQHTPNVLGIYLLRQVLEQVPSISDTEAQLVQRQEALYAFLAAFDYLKPLITRPEIRSRTVLTFEAAEDLVTDVKKQALQQGIRLGNGYGKWAKNTFRVANFPQHTEEDFDQLRQFFERYRK